jgi:hypothetical protein
MQERRLHTSFEALHISKSSVHRMMKELEILGLVDIGKDRGENYINLGDEFEWFLSKEFGNNFYDVPCLPFDENKPKPKSKIQIKQRQTSQGVSQRSSQKYKKRNIE